MQLWLSKQQREGLKEANRQMKYKMDVLSCAEHIHIIAHTMKVKAGTHDVLFSYDEMYRWAQEVNWGEYFHAALQSLKEKGLIEESTAPGQYYVDRPKF